MNNTNTNNYNLCVNWGLRCYEQVQTNNAIILKCTMSKKKGENEYTKPLYINVICSYGRCNVNPDNYEKEFINVDGQFVLDEFVDKNGEKQTALKIFASSVTLYTRN